MKIPRNAHEPISFGMSSNEILGFGEHVARFMEFTPGSKVAPFAQRIGGRIQSLLTGDIVAPDADSLIAYRENDFVARVKDPHAADRPDMNFELAILIGYLSLHFHRVTALHGPDAVMVVPYYSSTAIQKTCYREAFQFAVGFLCPRAIFAERWVHCSGNAQQFSSDLGIPTKHLPKVLDLILLEAKQAA